MTNAVTTNTEHDEDSSYFCCYDHLTLTTTSRADTLTILD